MLPSSAVDRAETALPKTTPGGIPGAVRRLRSLPGRIAAGRYRCVNPARTCQTATTHAACLHGGSWRQDPPCLQLRSSQPIRVAPRLDPAADRVPPHLKTPPLRRIEGARKPEPQTEGAIPDPPRGDLTRSQGPAKRSAARDYRPGRTFPAPAPITSQGWKRSGPRLSAIVSNFRDMDETDNLISGGS